MTKEKKEVQAVTVVEETAVSLSPMDRIITAIEKGGNIEQLGKLLDYQERWEANQAKKVYNSSMVDVHRQIPMVSKSLKNDQTHSRYASLDDIIVKTKDIYTKYGFSISFYEGETAKPEHVRICADVLHKQGHKESYYYDMPLDGKGIKGNTNMTNIHAKSSSTSYARRYLMCMIWNIPTGDDDDGNMASKANVEVISEEQLSTILEYIDTYKVSVERFTAHFKIESVEQLPKSKYQEALIGLKAKAGIK